MSRHYRVKPGTKWAERSWIGKAINGFFAYQLAAFFSLVWPVEVDLAVMQTLSENIEEEK